MDWGEGVVVFWLGANLPLQRASLVLTTETLAAMYLENGQAGYFRVIRGWSECRNLLLIL